MSRHHGEFDYLTDESHEQVVCDDCLLFAIVQDEYDANLCEECYIEAGQWYEADQHMKAIKEEVV